MNSSGFRRLTLARPASSTISAAMADKRLVVGVAHDGRTSRLGGHGHRDVGAGVVFDGVVLPAGVHFRHVARPRRRAMKSLTDSLMAPAWLARAQRQQRVHAAVHRQVEVRHGLLAFAQAAGDGAAHAAVRHAAAGGGGAAACGWPAARRRAPLPRRGAGCGHAGRCPRRARSTPHCAARRVPAGWTGGGRRRAGRLAGAAAVAGAQVAVAAQLERGGVAAAGAGRPALRPGSRPVRPARARWRRRPRRRPAARPARCSPAPTGAGGTTMRPSTPACSALISTMAFSVSISASASPTATVSPSCLSHWYRLPPEVSAATEGSLMRYATLMSYSAAAAVSGWRSGR